MHVAIEILLGLYGVGITGALVLLYKRTGATKPLETAWYEKSISTIGIVAFFSMTITAGIQTIKLAIDDYKLERSKTDMAVLLQEKDRVQALIARLSRATLSQVQEAGTLDRASQELLHHRLEVLLGSSSATKEELGEAFEISLILRDYQAAKELAAEHRDLLQQANPGDRLALAEFYFISGSKYAAKDILASLEPIGPTLPKPWQVRMIILKARIDEKADKYAPDLANLLQISPQMAKARIEHEIASDKTNAVWGQN